MKTDCIKFKLRDNEELLEKIVETINEKRKEKGWVTLDWYHYKDVQYFCYDPDELFGLDLSYWENIEEYVWNDILEVNPIEYFDIK